MAGSESPFERPRVCEGVPCHEPDCCVPGHRWVPMRWVGWLGFGKWERI